MSNDDDQMNQKVFDYLDNTLSEEERREVESLLAQSGRWRALLDAYQRTVKEIRTEFKHFVKNHVTNQALVAYVEDRKSLSQAEIDEIGLHLDICDVCSEKAAMLTAVAAEMAAETSEPESFWSRWWRKMAASLQPRFRAAATVAATAVVAILVYIGLSSHLGTDEPSFEFLAAGEVTYVPAQPREAIPVVSLQEQEGYVDMGLYFEPFFDTEDYALSLLDSAGSLLLTVPLREESYVAGAGYLIRLRSRPLAAGSYDLILSVKGKESDTLIPVEKYPFRLVK